MRRWISVLLFLWLASSLGAQVRSTAVAGRPLGGRHALFSLTASPFVSIPVGADAGLFRLGGGADLSAELRLPFLPLMYTGAQLEYSYLPTFDPSTSASAIALMGLAGMSFQLTPALAIKVFGTAGGFLAFLHGSDIGPEANPAFAGGVKIAIDFSESLGIGAESSYRLYSGLFNDIALRLSATYRIPASVTTGSDAALASGYLPVKNAGRGLQVTGLKAPPLFPVFAKYYDTHPLGEVELRNFESVPAASVKLTAIVKDYMDNLKESTVPARIKPGKAATAEVFALFNDKLLQIAETTRISLTLVLEYSQYGKTYREEYAPSMEVLFRNAMTWDDNRRMAAFISGRDPAAFGFARGVLAASSPAYNPALGRDLQSAMLIYEALRAFGISYVRDPSSVLAAQNKTVVDSLQFPQETLQYKTGDCDDLSILFCSLLESIGIETAFITTPGHVYSAFSLGLDPAEATQYLGGAQDFIERDERLWLPVETTALASDFIDAWQEGAREWIAAGASAGLYPVHDAWTLYPPVVLSGKAASPPLPAASALSAGLKSALRSLANRELTPRAAALAAEAKNSSSSARILNSLGVLYARFGEYAKAQEQFNAANAKGGYRPALLNLGNLLLVQRQYKQAAAQFQKALKIAPADRAGLVGLALAQDGMGAKEDAKTSFELLKATDPDLAARYTFLAGEGGESARAASADQASLILWQE